MPDPAGAPGTRREPGRPARRVLAALMLAALGACAPEGDLGRPRANVLNDEVMPAVGRTAARLREEPVSGYSFTDAERELRQLGYALMMPGHPTDRWNQFWAELRRTRIGDPVAYDPDPLGYCQTLAREDYRSAKSRFIRMVDDMRADRDRIPRFCAKAVEVAEADRVREGALHHVAALTAVEARSARDRIAENRTVIQWVRHGLAQRVTAYRCAVQKQVVATPEREAVLAERELAAFEADVTRFAQCSPPPPRGRIDVEPVPRGFYPMSPPAPPPESPIPK